jgi:hypothetical protein
MDRRLRRSDLPVDIVALACFLIGKILVHGRDIEARTRTIPLLFGTGYADIQTYAHTYMDMHISM